MPQLLPDSPTQQHQQFMPSLLPTGLPDLSGNASSFCSSPVSYSSSPIMSYSPASPVSGASSPTKSGKKKARNRPPKHVRKGFAFAKPDEPQCASPQHSLKGSFAADVSETSITNSMYDATGKQSNQLASRVISAPINVPLKALVSDADELKLEAFSSPKWLGTGFADKLGAGVLYPFQHYSQPETHVASDSFTYFARSMW